MKAFRLLPSRLPGETIIVLSFVALILCGTVLLELPASNAGPRLSLIDALFTATSAACVTGLVVVDTGTHFTPLGHAVLLALIQAGGLGIVTFSSFFAVLLGKRIPMRRREVVRQTYSTIDSKSFLQLLRRIVLFTLAIEGIGAVLLFLAWHRDFPGRVGIWQSVFHSVSAFCNAGFSLFPDSMIRYQRNWAVNLVLMFLIVIGGLGFLVIYDIERRLLFKIRLSLHTRLALLTSAGLIVFGTVMFLILEYGNVLQAMTLPQKLLVSLFHSVVPRTAGFNSIDYAQITGSTMVLTMVLMFIGGSPGSTAGGVKTTTVALFLANAWSQGRGYEGTNIMRRTVPDKNVNEARGIILIAATVLLVFNFTIQWTENGHRPHRVSTARFIETSFETVSAFGTVGLSAGTTQQLSSWGKIQIALLMLIGRVGPLTVAVVIARRHRSAVYLEYYKENVMVG